MYLKALEMQGFKSFPDKTRLVFDKPVTAIVGPNGSGKSNISDALLWVMGEQSSKALRGGKMEDVIFGGTQKRGQVGFAEVSLILDNSAHIFDLDNTEVMITRRYYRSGESEYYINKHAVRLRDITELLMDTGLGRYGYSIIGQGRIDEILSAKSTDRREIFEEAAGISKFRKRKEESERKLMHTDENLVRINDRIAELEIQVEPLRKQAETAKKFLLLRDELRGLEVSVWVDTLERLAAQREKTDADYHAAAMQLNDAEKMLEQIYGNTEAHTAALQQKNLEADRAREAASAAEVRVSEISGILAMLQSNVQNCLEQAAQIRQELSEFDTRDDGIMAQIREREDRIAAIGDELTALQEQAAALTAQADEIARTAGASAEELAALLRRENTAAGDLADAKVRLSARATSAQELDDREYAVSTELQAAQTQLETAKTESADCADRLKQAIDTVTGMRNSIAGREMLLESSRKKAESAKDKKVALTMELNALRSRIGLLTEMEKEYQGYSKAVRVVMQEAARGRLKNVCGTVADCVRVDDRYTLAIETALGAAMQNVIVESDMDGKAGIQFLKSRDIGRATFQPISTVRGEPLRERGLESEDGFAGLGCDLVYFEEKYRGIYTNLLGRTAIVESMDDAIRIARKYRHKFRIVTLDGQVLNAGGSMTGGSASKNAGILSRANELSHLQEREKTMVASVGEAEEACVKAERAFHACSHELETARIEMRQFEDEQLRLEAEQRHYAVLISGIEENYTTLKAELQAIRGRIEENKKEIETVRGDIQKSEETLAALRLEIDAQTAGQEELNARRTELSEEMAALHTHKVSLETERSAVEQAVSELRVFRDDLSGDRAGKTAALERLDAQEQDIRADIAAQEELLTAATAERERLKAEITRLTDEKLRMEADRTRLDKEYHEQNHVIVNLQGEVNRLEQKKISAEMEEKQIVDKLWDMYELSRSAAIEQRLEIANMADAKKRITDLKREISRLGNPNIGAIEEFERVNTRYTYLTEQRDDVEKAKSELLKIIGDITDEMREIFAREFQVINESFKETFLELFGGGRAALELEDPEDILNCGIEIKVQPPGKSLKTLTLLSGGEKAFVAIALYFAVIKVRPTPFIIMDEIEAALDEANVLRVAEYMRKISEKTQVLVITHRRGTMEEADVLYGVTMQEQGVSKILNVDLEEAEKTLAK